MDNFDDAASAKEEYLPAISAQSFSLAVNLDFETRDVEGQFVTPEGVLKHKILLSFSTKTAAAAAGVLNPVHGVVGMAGVGKTIALQSLTSDKDIRARFLMAFSTSASVKMQQLKLLFKKLREL